MQLVRGCKESERCPDIVRLTSPMMNVNYLRKVRLVGGWDARHLVSWGMEGHVVGMEGNASNANNADKAPGIKRQAKA